GTAGGSSSAGASSGAAGAGDSSNAAGAGPSSGAAGAGPRRGASGVPDGWVSVGRVGRPHGVNGEVAVDQAALTPIEMQDVRQFAWLGADGARRDLVLASVRPALDRLLVHFEGFDTRAAAATLVRGT